MKVSYKWLKQYLDLNMPAKDLAEKIERTAVEVDSVTVAEDGLSCCRPHFINDQTSGIGPPPRLPSGCRRRRTLTNCVGPQMLTLTKKLTWRCPTHELAATLKSSVPRCAELNHPA